MTDRKWHKGLTARELRHVMESTTTGTRAQFRRNLEHQRADEAAQLAAGRHEDDVIVLCRECRRIGDKLGL